MSVFGNYIFLYSITRESRERIGPQLLFICNLVPRALFPGLGGGAGKGPGIGRPIRHFDWLIDLGNSCKKMAR